MFLSLVFVLIFVTFAFSQKKMTRELEEKVKKLDPSTKKRILQMANIGMPKDSIAKTIKYIAGNNINTAHRIIEGVQAEHQSAINKAKLRK
jgi:hypothetical protein